MSDKKKNTENSKTVVFDGNEYMYSDLITTNGDSVRTYLPVHLVKPGQLYTIKHVSSPDGTLRLLTSVETGEILPGQEVRISPTSSWGKTLIQAFPRWSGQFQPSDDYSTSPWWLKMFYKITGYKLGGWLHKYQNGGMTLQPSQEQVMKELLNIVQQAATELQSNKPGQGVQTLAQIANDPQGSQLLDVLVQQVPEAGQIVEAVMKMVGAFKCGGKTKKKVKKGAKGCVPCKKLMRVGGKLINVLTDCEGNIISKHQAGGWLIPKGEKGLTAEQQAMLNTSHDLNWAKQLAASTSVNTAKTGKHYYKGADGSIYEVEAENRLDGSIGWGTPRKVESSEDNTLHIDRANNKINGVALTNLAGLGNAYTTNTQAAQAIQYTDGTNWYTSTPTLGADGKYYYGQGVLAKTTDFDLDDFKDGITVDNFTTGHLTPEQASAAGIDSSKFEGETPMVRGVKGKAPNSLFGTAAENPTMEDYKAQYGDYSGIVAHENKLYKDMLNEIRGLRRAMYKSARHTRMDDNASNDKSRLSVYRHSQNLKKELKANRANQAATIIDDWFKSNIDRGTYIPTSGSNSQTTNLGIVGGAASTSNASLSTNLGLIKSKQGGWLTKFLDGGKVKKYKDGEKVYRKATPYESALASPSLYSTKEDNGYTLPADYLAYATPDMWKWDVIAPTNIKFPLLKELIGYIPKTDAPIGRLIRTFNIEGIPNDTSYITHSKHPFKSIRYENIEKGEDGYKDFLQLFKSTLNE